jgi:hypothetical protein
MAHFKYMGETSNAIYGPCLEIKVPLQNGSKLILKASDKIAGFMVGYDIGYDFVDTRSLMFLRADPRFKEI